MSDPVSGGAGKIAEQMLKEVQQAMQTEQLAQQQAQDATQVNRFENVLQTQQVNNVQATESTQRTTEVLRSATNAQRVPELPAAGHALDTSRLRTGFQRVVEDIMKGQDKYGKIMELAMSGREFSQTELLALQAGVYRFSQELELTSKVIEKGTSAVKQTLNTQV